MYVRSAHIIEKTDSQLLKCLFCICKEVRDQPNDFVLLLNQFPQRASGTKNEPENADGMVKKADKGTLQAREPRRLLRLQTNHQGYGVGPKQTSRAMRVVIKGLNYTEMRLYNKETWGETVMFWKLSRLRKPRDCGVWQDGKRIMEYEDMVDEGLSDIKKPKTS